MSYLKPLCLSVVVVMSGCSFFEKKPKEEPVVEVPQINEVKTHAWLDEYEPRVREAIKGSKFEVERRDTVLVVVAPADSAFNPDRPGLLLPVSLAPITRLAKILEADGESAALVLGHADSSGDDQKNRQLSQERAQAFSSIFRLSGLQRDRLLLKGVGSDMPRAANDSTQGRSLNRRVEIVLTRKDTLYALLAQYSRPAQPLLDNKQQAVAAEQGKAKAKP